VNTYLSVVCRTIALSRSEASDCHATSTQQQKHHTCYVPVNIYNIHKHYSRTTTKSGMSQTVHELRTAHISRDSTEQIPTKRQHGEDSHPPKSNEHTHLPSRHSQIGACSSGAAIRNLRSSHTTPSPKVGITRRQAQPRRLRPV